MDEIRRGYAEGNNPLGPNGENWEREPQSSGSAFDQIKGTIADKLQAAASTIEQQASGLGGSAQESYGRYGQTAADWMNRSAGYIRDADVERLKNDVTDQVRQNPGRTLLIAGAAGLVLGALFRRR